MAAAAAAAAASVDGGGIAMSLVARVLVIGGVSAVMPALKGGSLVQAAFDPLACEEAMHAGASCSLCVSKFKLCRGHFVYEPFTVVIAEAVITIALGTVVTFAAVGRSSPPGSAVAMLTNWSALRRVAPIGATYALADMIDLVAAARCSATTLLVAAQLRLPLCALLRWWLLGRGQTRSQWAMLLLITAFCVGSVMDDIQGHHLNAATSGGWVDILETVPLILCKCVISCCGAIHAEYFLQFGEVSKLPLPVTQVHFKAATLGGALVMGYYQGRRGGRILADMWHGDLFHQLPPGTRPGDSRTPFFGGWDGGTWLLTGCLIAQNFLIGDQLRRLSSVAKYVAYSVGLVMSHLVLLASGRPLDVSQTMCCFGIAVSAVVYVTLPPSRPKPEVANGGKSTNGKASSLNGAASPAGTNGTDRSPRNGVKAGTKKDD